MLWTEIQTGMIAAVRAAARTPGLDVYWTERTNAWHADAEVKLDVVSFEGIGVDEPRRTILDEGIQDRMYGVRTLRIQFTCEVQHQTLGASAMFLADQVMSGLRSTPARAALMSANVAPALTSVARAIPYTDDHGRRRSVVVFDILFNTSTTIVFDVDPWTEEILAEGFGVDVVATTG